MTDDASRNRRSESAVRRVIREYRFEFVWLALVIVGLLLIFERSAIRLWLMAAARFLAAALLSKADGLADQLSRLSLSDLVGLALVLAAVTAIAWRLRWRAMRSPRLTLLACPRCGAPIRRVHRRTVDRIISTLVPVKRYRCSSSSCSWKGLRVGLPKGVPQPAVTNAPQHS